VSGGPNDALISFDFFGNSTTSLGDGNLSTDFSYSASQFNVDNRGSFRVARRETGFQSLWSHADSRRS
jgi:hypothetical protein